MASLATVVALADPGSRSWLFEAVKAVPLGDKVGHLALMGLLSFLLNMTCQCRTVPMGGLRVLVGSAIACLVVVVEELSQIWIAHRNLELLDLLSDLIGIYAFDVLRS